MKILKENDLYEAKSSKIPIERQININDDEYERISNPTFYKKLVGKLIYLNISMLDLSFGVHWLSQFMNNPKEIHLKVLLKLIIRCI